MAAGVIILIILQDVNRLSVCIRGTMFPKESQVLKLISHNQNKTKLVTAPKRFFFFLKTVLLRAPPFLTVTTEVHVDTCYREMGSPCLSRVAFSFSTLILARSSSSSSSCFLFSPSLFSSRYRATFLWLASTSSCSSLASCRGRNLSGSWWG